MKTKFNVVEWGTFDELNILTPKDLSELTGGCFIDMCGAKICGAQVNFTGEKEQYLENY